MATSSQSGWASQAMAATHISDQPLCSEADVTFPPDDDVVVDGHAQQPPGFGDAVGELDVSAAGLRGAGGRVMAENERRRWEGRRVGTEGGRGGNTRGGAENE